MVNVTKVYVPKVYVPYHIIETQRDRERDREREKAERQRDTESQINRETDPMDTRRKVNVFCTFNLRPVSREETERKRNREQRNLFK